ncbi:hypothetical protein AVEN_22638-1 [Araneus ventricosus]|uniref:Uncharacterized protein n=1 Tax=Araneus ventricosus TaxID=182803 RepID=A0A4Y2JK40_ARAVE|nr:hypothetical protein AVEN_22638-1 [Araneus ventricosus]
MHCPLVLEQEITGESFSFWQCYRVREIPRALHIPKELFDSSCNDVATSSTDVEAISFLPLSHFTSNEPDSSNLSIIFFRPNAVIEPEPLLNPLMSGISSMQLPRCHRSCNKASQAEPDPSMIGVMTTFSDAELEELRVPRRFIASIMCGEHVTSFN